jgi:hypothetical protein
MTCQECELLLARGEAGASVEDHLRGCVNCRALQEDLQANALALSSLRDDELPRIKAMKRRPALPRRVPWLASAAAAVLLVLIAYQASKPRLITETRLQPRQMTAPATVTVELPPKPAPKLPVRREAKPVLRSAPVGQQLLVKMLTPDPDVVVYWIVD